VTLSVAVPYDRELGSPSNIRQASLAALATTWQQSREGEDTLGTFGFSREVNAIFRIRPTNVFLNKVTYWLSR